MNSFSNYSFLNIFSVFLIIIGLIAIWFYRRIKIMTLLNKNGIPGAPPHLIFGNIFRVKGLSIVESQKNLIERYGKIVGYYRGAKPYILVADPELAKRILIKDFNYFTNRSLNLDYSRALRKTEGSLLTIRDKRWKLIRSLISPAFSTYKLKDMTPIIKGSVDTFMNIINKKSETEEEFNIYELYQRLVIELIMKTAFGVEVDKNYYNNNNRILNKIQFITETNVNKFILLIFLSFPEFANVIQFLRGMTQLISNWLGFTHFSFMWDICTQIIELRKKDPGSRPNDILQAMLDSRITKDELSETLCKSLNDYEEDSEENMKKREQNEKHKINFNQIHLNEDEIKENCILFFGGGVESTSTSLAFLTHFLINYPEIQKMIREEVIELYESEGKLDYNCINKLHYMEWCIDETLRLYPPFAVGSTRECAADYKYKNITIPKGTTVVICTHLLHHDPDNWPEPGAFDPMRFSPERRHEIKTGAWLPFGDGPRNCIARRLVNLSLKLILAKTLLEYRFEAGHKSEIGEITVKYKSNSTVPENGLFVKVVKI